MTFWVPYVQQICLESNPMREDGRMTEKIKKTEEEWRKELTPEQYRVLRQKGTERPFTGEYEDVMTPGVYKCAACGQELFLSDTKFDSGCGWPSFFQPAAEDKIDAHEDNSSWNAARRGDLFALRRASRTRVSRWPEADRTALLHQLGIVEAGPENQNDHHRDTEAQSNNSSWDSSARSEFLCVSVPLW